MALSRPNLSGLVLGFVLGSVGVGVLLIARNQPAEAIRRLGDEPVTFMTGKEYLRECTRAELVPGPLNVDRIVEYSARHQACWTIVEATVDALRAEGANCANMDTRVAFVVKRAVQDRREERLSGVQAIAKALIDSGICSRST